MLFWQEELWTRFAGTQQGEVPRSFAGISEALCLCPIHNLPLRSEAVPVIYGLVYFPPEYVQARDEHFPFANEVAYGGCGCGPQERATVLRCEACRREGRRWRERGR